MPTFTTQNMEGVANMLVLSRKERETIFIGDHIEITIVRIRGNHVRVGIKAPLDVPIQRQELARRIHHAADTPVELTPAATPLPVGLVT